MINSISRFLATPSPVFELDVGGEINAQQYAIIRLAQCVESKPEAQMSQVAISTLYALLNEISRYSGEKGELGAHAISGAPAAEQLDEKQKQQVCTNALSAIVGVAVYLKDESVSGYNGRRITTSTDNSLLSIRSCCKPSLCCCPGASSSPLHPWLL